jgi:hypothetical protein
MQVECGESRDETLTRRLLAPDSFSLASHSARPADLTCVALALLFVVFCVDTIAVSRNLRRFVSTGKVQALASSWC